MTLKLACSGAAAALLSFAACAQTQSGSSLPPSGGGLSAPPPLAAPSPSTGTSGDRAGLQGSTAPRSSSSETSVGVSGAYSPPAPDRTSGLCDTLTGDERIRCQREQAATGTQGGAPGSAGAGSTGMGR